MIPPHDKLLLTIKPSKPPSSLFPLAEPARSEQTPFNRQSMPNPTAPVLTAAFVTATGIFLITALIRWFLRKNQSPPTEILASPIPETGIGNPDLTPHRPPVLPPPLVPGVPVWPYGPIDFILAGLIVLIFGGLSYATAAADPGKIEYNAAALLSSIIFQFTLAAVTLAFVVWRIGPVAWLGLRWKNWPWVFLIAPLTVVGMWLVFGGLQQAGYMKWIESFGVEALQDSVKLLQNSQDMVILSLMAVAAVIVAPICEEIVFRGYLYAFAKKYTGPWIAAACSGLIFAAAHGSLAALLPLFIFGIVLALLYEKTGSIWAPIAVHFCFNGATVAIQFLARQFPQILEQAQQ